MIAIAAVDKNGAIGSHGNLLFRIHADLKNFKALTLGKTIICGRKTMDTFPGGKPLPNRRNIIMSHDPDLHCEGAIVCHSIEELLDATQGLPSDSLFVVGGESIYRQLQPYINCIYLTRVDAVADHADAFFFHLDQWWKEQVLSAGMEGSLYYKISRLTRF